MDSAVILQIFDRNKFQVVLLRQLQRFCPHHRSVLFHDFTADSHSLVRQDASDQPLPSATISYPHLHALPPAEIHAPVFEGPVVFVPSSVRLRMVYPRSAAEIPRCRIPLVNGYRKCSRMVICIFETICESQAVRPALHSSVCGISPFAWHAIKLIFSWSCKFRRADHIPSFSRPDYPLPERSFPGVILQSASSTLLYWYCFSILLLPPVDL